MMNKLAFNQQDEKIFQNNHIDNLQSISAGLEEESDTIEDGA